MSDSASHTTARDPYLQQRLQMVEQQIRRRGISDHRVLYAMEALPRHEFVPPSVRGEAYDDRALPIGLGQTISQPYMVGLMLSLLEVEPDHKVLEVGAGSGYVAALLGMLGREVYALELVAELAEQAVHAIQRLELANVHIVAGDGSAGYPEAAPFDRIVVSAAAPAMPQPLVEQLVEGGRLLAPVGGRAFQTCQVGTKHGGELRIRQSIDCVFVPLLGEHGWKDDR
jgi:protein-L-isoaspartate(D-aspartate) O-methyltransferase